MKWLKFFRIVGLLILVGAGVVAMRTHGRRQNVALVVSCFGAIVLGGAQATIDRRFEENQDLTR